MKQGIGEIIRCALQGRRTDVIVFHRRKVIKIAGLCDVVVDLRAGWPGQRRRRGAEEGDDEHQPDCRPRPGLPRRPERTHEIDVSSEVAMDWAAAGVGSVKIRSRPIANLTGSVGRTGSGVCSCEGGAETSVRQVPEMSVVAEDSGEEWHGEGCRDGGTQSELIAPPSCA